MKAALIVKPGEPPVYADFKDPVPSADTRLIRVTAASISHITRNRASGKHYSAQGSLPFVPGVDGVGIAEDGQRVYFLLPEAPWGAMAEQTVVDAAHCFVVPQGVNDVDAAAMAIPGMSSWAALSERARFQRGETVLINGATGTSGRLAVQIAKHLGAKKVIATGRNVETLAALRTIGADITIALSQDHETFEAEFMRVFAERIDVVLDYLWGTSAQTLLVAAAKASPDGVPVRFVQIGAASGSDIELPSAVLRSSALELMGSGIGSVPFDRLLKAIQGVLDAAPMVGFEVKTEVVPLAAIASVWSKDNGPRVVVQP